MDPRPSPEATSNVILSTPMVVLGMMTHVLRQRFLPANQGEPVLPWLWNEELESTGIFIETGFNKELEARTTRPGIWVDQIQTVYSRSAIGHQAPEPWDPKTSLERFHIFGHTDISVECTSPNHGESLMLGSIVQDFVQMSTFLIQRWFGLREISEVLLNHTTPFEHDDNLWSTPVQFRVGYETRWESRQMVSLLNQIALTLTDVGDDPHETRLLLARRALGL